MAVYYKWIKGCQTGASVDSGLWSFITWGRTHSTNEPTSSDSLSSYGTSVMPRLKIKIGKDNTNENPVDLGYFLTTEMPLPLIKSKFIFNNRIYFANGSFRNNDTEPALTDKHGEIQQTDQYFSIKAINTKDGKDLSELWVKSNSILLNDNGYGPQDQELDSVVKISSYTDRFEKGVSVTGKTTLRGGVATTSILDVKGGTNLGLASYTATAFFPYYTGSGEIIFNEDLKIVDKSCTAHYFNATSDKRAKENIKKATYSALELIEKLPVYVFNYKNNNEVVTGILAQDLLAAQPDGLDLVSNKDASGENNDYMSIKNDKLMFVLMKAIQEQQEQIYKLQAELNIIKESL